MRTNRSIGDRVRALPARAKVLRSLFIEVLDTEDRVDRALFQQALDDTASEEHGRASHAFQGESPYFAEFFAITRTYQADYEGNPNPQVTAAFCPDENPL